MIVVNTVIIIPILPPRNKLEIKLELEGTRKLEKLIQSSRENSNGSQHKKWSFPVRISSANVTKSAVSYGFGHIYWRNPSWKTSFFVQWLLQQFRRFSQDLTCGLEWLHLMYSNSSKSACERVYLNQEKENEYKRFLSRFSKNQAFHEVPSRTK